LSAGCVSDSANAVERLNAQMKAIRDVLNMEAPWFRAV
jgi:hypothetical protein